MVFADILWQHFSFLYELIKIITDKAQLSLSFTYRLKMSTAVKQRVCGLLGGLSYVSTVDVSY
jgi:hypothetical protein